MRKRAVPVGHGAGQRQLRVGEAIRRALSAILQRGEIHDPELALVPVTVGEVRVSPDLRHATAFVLPLGGAGTEALLALLERNRAEIRRRVAEAVNLKYAPEIRFEADRSFDRMEETRRLLGSAAVRRDLGDGG